MRPWLELTSTISYTYSRNEYSYPDKTISNFNTWGFGLVGRVYILKDWLFTTNLNKKINTGYSSAVNANPMILNASLERSFWKRRATIRLEAINLADQTANVTQSISANSVVETRNQVLGRYFLLSFQFELKDFKGK